MKKGKKKEEIVREAKRAVFSSCFFDLIEKNVAMRIIIIRKGIVMKNLYLTDV